MTKRSEANFFSVIGLMSGTSLDGVDIAFCTFHQKNGKWTYAVHAAETIAYSKKWKQRLSSLEKATAQEFAAADAEYGHYLGKITREFMLRHSIRPQFISSHGHTIFHQPGRRLTTQIGKGSSIAAETGLPCVCDFRSLDVALGGQGAPLVPVGDRLLFGSFDYCLNLGGFANISFEEKGERIAYDVCPANIVLNHLAAELHQEYDKNGDLARRGRIHPEMIKRLNRLSYYSERAPKSLGKEWVLTRIHPILGRYDIPVADKLRSFTEHIACQVAQSVNKEDSGSILVTGGGAFNQFLLDMIREKTKLNLVVPDPLTINYKEALIFALLGILRWRREVNCLKTYTGATRDNIGGAIYDPFRLTR